MGSFTWLGAIACGVGSEAILRSQFFIKQTEAKQDIVAGPLDLLKFWQNLGLKYVGEHLAKKRREFIDKHLPKLPFLQLRNVIVPNLGALTNEDTAKQLTVAIAELVAEFEKAGMPNDEEYRFKLGYLLYRHLGREEFKAVVQA